MSSEGACPKCGEPLGIGGRCIPCAIESDPVAQAILERLNKRDYPTCAVCGAGMVHYRLHGYRCGRDQQHEGIVWPEGSPQARFQERLGQ